jgi:uncharacterized membrane protein
VAVLIVQLLATLIARVRVAWPDAARIGMAALFLFTGASHFSSLKHDFAAMIPPPLTGAMWVVYVSGVLEIMGAVGLLVPSRRRTAAICLIVLLVAMFPANVYAAVKGTMVGGRPATDLWLRTPMQLFWMATLWWSSVAHSRRVPDGHLGRGD